MTFNKSVDISDILLYALHLIFNHLAALRQRTNANSIIPHISSQMIPLAFLAMFLLIRAHINMSLVIFSENFLAAWAFRFYHRTSFFMLGNVFSKELLRA